MSNKRMMRKKTIIVSWRAALMIMCFSAGIQGLTCTKSVYAATQKIIAVVNDDVISDSDLDSRMLLVVSSSGLPNNAEIRQKLLPQVIDGLISEQLMLQEAKGLNIIVDKKEIDAGFAQIAQQNKMTADQFLSMLKRGGIDVSTMARQIEAQVAWSKVVQSLLNPKIVISGRDIDDALDRMKAKIGTTEYLVAEIYLSVDDAKKDGQVGNLARSLFNEIKAGKASFFKLAQQFSQAAGAKNGGDKGWVNEAQLSEELLEGLKKIDKDQVTNPIKTVNGYHILMLREKRTLSDETVPSRQQIEYSIGNQRLDKLQRQHLMDLRSSSYIDIRIQS